VWTDRTDRVEIEPNRVVIVIIILVVVMALKIKVVRREIGGSRKRTGEIGVMAANPPSTKEES